MKSLKPLKSLENKSLKTPPVVAQCHSAALRWVDREPRKTKDLAPVTQLSGCSFHDHTSRVGRDLGPKAGTAILVEPRTP